MDASLTDFGAIIACVLSHWPAFHPRAAKLAALIDSINNIDTIADESKESEEDIVGRVYEYFLGKFAATEGLANQEIIRFLPAGFGLCAGHPVHRRPLPVCLMSPGRAVS